MLRFDQSEKYKRPTTLLNSDAGVGTNEDAREELTRIFRTEAIIDYPKPTSLLRYLVRSCTYFERDGVILDFFAGSCTTAQAVLELNREDGGNRRFIMVQLPQLTGNPNFSTIADIGKERIRRVSGQMKHERASQLKLDGRTTPEDLGFRIFKLAASNLRPWQGGADPTPEDYADQMALFRDLLAGDWQPAGVIWEVAVKEGFGLDASVEAVSGLTHNTVYRVADPDRDQAFLICLDAQLHPETIDALGLTKDDLFVCRDIALTDSLAANLALQCRLKTL